MNLIEIMDKSRIISTLINFNSTRSQNLIDISELQNHFTKLITVINVIDESIQGYLMKKGWISKFYNFLFNDSFASYHKFKIDILNKYNCEEFSNKTNNDSEILNWFYIIFILACY